MSSQVVLGSSNRCHVFLVHILINTRSQFLPSLQFLRPKYASWSKPRLPEYHHLESTENPRLRDYFAETSSQVITWANMRLNLVSPQAICALITTCHVVAAGFIHCGVESERVFVQKTQCRYNHPCRHRCINQITVYGDKCPKCSRVEYSVTQMVCSNHGPTCPKGCALPPRC